MVEVSAYRTAGSIISTVCAEIGLPVPANDPYQSTNPQLVRLCALLASTGGILQGMHEWQNMEVVYELQTQVGDTGVYPLPPDFSALTDQTGWQQNYFWPLRGPYSAQMWQRIVNYPTTGIYIAFRIQNNQLWLWPQPPPVAIGISFVYKSTYWCLDGVSATAKEVPTQGSDIVNFDWLMVSRFLKLRFLSSMGHDTGAAADEFKIVFDAKTAQADGAAPELQLARNEIFPFLTGFNSPDTGFGGQGSGGGYM